jgi:hypothetical protein
MMGIESKCFLIPLQINSGIAITVLSTIKSELFICV